jgi:acyl-CoA reductase-like NAD-dependent aldehyde dehydrogenase
VDAQFGEIMSSCGKLDWVVAEGEAVLAPEARPTNFTSMHKVARVEYAPLGVVGVIAPWNYPFYNLYNHIASGLFAGNACVLKISEYAAWSGAAYIRVARDALAAHGYSPDLVQLVQGFGETGAALVAACDKVIFTGSPGIGKAVMGVASRTLTPLVLELGGKDPFIVCDDADVDAALTLALRGTFQNAGQNCVGIERIYVHEGLYDAFVAKAREAVSRLRVGPAIAEEADGKAGGYADVDVGCITTAPQLPLIQGLVDDAVAKGAVLHCGGRILFAGAAGDAAAPPAPAASTASPASSSSGAGAVPSSPAAPVSRRGRGKSPSASAAAAASSTSAASPSRATRSGSVTSRPAAAAPSGAAAVNAAADPALAAAAASRYAPAVSGGLFYAPTLLTGVTHEMRIANEEVFGPVMAVFKVPRNDDAEAVRMANSTAYGLGATVFSSSPARANRIAAQLRCGMVGVNAFGLNYLVQSLPFGGVGASGFDRFAGPEGLRACCLLKSVVTDMTSAFSIPTPVPKPLQYPVAASASSFTEGLIALQFAPSLWQKVLGLARMAGLPVKLQY